MKALFVLITFTFILKLSAQQNIIALPDSLSGIVDNSNMLIGNGKTVLLDYYFNNEYKKNDSGKIVRFHYTWEDTNDSGFSLFGDICKKTGASIQHLSTAPTRKNLNKASVYIIVDPDTERETTKPNYISDKHAAIIYQWVKSGGVLLLLMNDSSKADFKHTNLLATKFGIQFIENSLNKVEGDHYESGAFSIPKNDSIFKTAKKIYIKELSSIKLTGPATAHFKNANGDVIMAITNVGKGRVFAVGDPWFYNEYINTGRLRADFENYKAAEDLVRWLLKSTSL